MAHKTTGKRYQSLYDLSWISIIDHDGQLILLSPSKQKYSKQKYLALPPSMGVWFLDPSPSLGLRNRTARTTCYSFTSPLRSTNTH